MNIRQRQHILSGGTAAPPVYTASITPPVGAIYTGVNKTFAAVTDVPTPTYTWSVGAGASIVSGQGTANVVISFSTGGSKTVSLSVGGGGSASAEWTGTVTLSTASITPPGSPIYTGNRTFTGSTNVPTPTYTWGVGAGATISSGQGTSSVVINFPSAGSKSVSLDIAGGAGTASASWAGTVESPPFNYSDYGTVLLHIDASDASTVTESSGVITELRAKIGGWVFQNSEASERPIYDLASVNGRNAILFDGVNDSLDSTATWDQNQPYTIFVVVRLKTGFTSGYRAAFATTSPQVSLAFVNLAFIIPIAGNSRFPSQSHAAEVNNLVMAIYDSAGGGHLARFNKAQYSTSDWGSSKLGGTLRLGNSAGETQALGGHLCEMLIYQGVMTSPNYGAVETELSTKWATP